MAEGLADDIRDGSHATDQQSELESLKTSLARLRQKLQDCEERVSQTQRRFGTLRKILQNMPVMIDAFDAQGLIIAWNRECERVTGYAAADILRKPDAMQKLYPNAEYREAMMSQWRERGDNYYNWEWQMTARDGTVKTVLWSNISAQFPIPGWATWGIGVDVTRRHEAQKQLEAYQAKMARTEQLASVGTLSAVMAHELSQDLTAIHLSIQNALETLAQTNDIEDAKGDLEEAGAAVRKAVSRVAQIKAFSRLSWRDSIEPVALDEVCRRIITLFRSAMVRARLTVQMHCAGAPLTLWANERDVEQLFFSLIENAMQAADASRDNHLTISISRSDRQFELRFDDDCAGIAPEHLEKVFDPFFTTRPPSVGTGLGLFIAKNIVERAKGTIQLESRPDEGTTVTIILPVRAAAETSSPPKSLEVDSPSSRV
jgi:PAS domain S-box-containing protein